MTDLRKSTHPKKRAFLAAFALTGNVLVASETAGVPRRTIYEWRRADPEFAAAMDLAREEACDRLEEEARRRAYDGTEEPVFGRVERDRDGQVGTVQKYSDTLLIFLLKGNKPEKFRERVEHSGRVAHEVTRGPDLSGLSADDLDAIATIASKLADGGPGTGAAGD